MQISDEGLLPQSGEKVVVISSKVKSGKMEEAKRYLREVIFPRLAQDEFPRDSYVLENTAGSELVSLILMRGGFTADPELATRIEKHVKAPQSGPERTIEDTLFGTNNESQGRSRAGRRACDGSRTSLLGAPNPRLLW